MKFKAATLVFCVFLTGAVVGGLSVHIFGDRIWSSHASDPSSQFGRDELLQQLSQQLNLSPEQRGEIKGIMDQTVSNFHRVLISVNPEFVEARQQGRQRIRGVLTPEQLPKFEVFIRQLDERRAKAEQLEQQQQPKQDQTPNR